MKLEDSVFTRTSHYHYHEPNKPSPNILTQFPNIYLLLHLFTSVSSKWNLLKSYFLAKTHSQFSFILCVLHIEPISSFVNGMMFLVNYVALISLALIILFFSCSINDRKLQQNSTYLTVISVGSFTD